MRTDNYFGPQPNKTISNLHAIFLVNILLSYFCQKSIFRKFIFLKVLLTKVLFSRDAKSRPVKLYWKILATGEKSLNCIFYLHILTILTHVAIIEGRVIKKIMYR
jgi:hypothetical protein